MDEVVGVILAAGRGRRLGSLGEDYVKTLLPVANEPLIGHHLRLLGGLGVRRVLVVVGHHAAQVERALGNGERYGLEVQLVRQPAPLGSAHALAAVRSCLRTPFLLLLGDYYFVAARPETMIERLARGESAIAVKREPEPRLICEACAVETTAEGRVVAIVEKPSRPLTDLKGCGFYALVPEALDAVTRTPRTALRDEYELTVSLELFVQAGNALYAEEIIDWDYNLTRPEDLLECNLDWLDRHGMSNLVANRAFVDGQTELQRTVVGEGAAVRGVNLLKEVVVFPGTEVVARGSVERTLFTPEGSISCGPSPQLAQEEGAE
ncbi:MAG TPA: sugar phosphate nucleotidyltransferase [Thermoanaerobaculia bacterium]|jgi:dTDP-glucose pyrophosphorylase